ncbi:cyclin-domain-containing protein [Sarocladium strictum]
MPPPPSADGGIATQSRTDAAIHAASSSSSFPPHSDDTTTQPPPPPAPKPLTASTGSLHTVDPSNEPVTTGSTSVEPTSALSPNKRRGSPPAPIASVASNDQPNVDSGDIASKRSRHDERPAKILPHQYELCSRDDIVELIAHMVGELITTNDAIRVANGGLTRFHSRTAPGISVRDYLHRLAKHATLTPPLLLAMVYYIDRLCAMYPEFTINTLTVHRFLITAATVAAKGLSDAFWNNTTYARVGGIRVAELRLLELEFLYRVDWRIVPNPEVLVAYYQGLVERAPGYELDPEGMSDDDELGDELDESE